MRKHIPYYLHGVRMILFFLVQFTTSVFLYAQVSGIVRETGSDKALNGAEVFINHTTISTRSDGNGQFVLEGLAPGFVEFVVYKEGYQIFKSPIRIQEGKGFKLNLKLVRSEPLATSSAPKDRETTISDFKVELLGTSPFALRSRIINPQALQFSENVPVSVTLKEPLVVENLAVGYRITFYLDPVGVELSNVLGAGVVRFDMLVPRNNQQLNEWNQGREGLFFGSQRHLFWSLVNERAEQGFALLDEQGRPLSMDSVIKPSKIPGYRKVKFPGKTEVRYLRAGKESEPPVSWIVSRDAVDVNAEGIPLNERSLDVSGAMETGLAEWIPSNYFPVARMDALNKAREVVKLLQEKIYIHTDKPYYYPGEVLWLKGYVNYVEPVLRDSLSQVMYVELISPEKAVLLTRILKIENGSVRGDFIFPDSLKAGNYSLRAYTNLMRNFGDATLTVKTIPVMNTTDKVDPGQASEKPACTEGLSIVSDKPHYAIREKIGITIKLMDTGDKPLGAGLSVSVTDASQVVAIPELLITREFPFKDNTALIPAELNYRIESGISFSGQFFNDRGKKEKTTITLVQGKFENVITRDTDGQGYFVENGYQFFDSADFSIQGKNPKGKVYGRVEVEKRQVPEMDITPSDRQLVVIATKVPQRVISEYEVPREARILQEVTVSVKRLQTSPFVSNRYGSASRLFGNERLFGTSMLSSMMGLIPGLKITYTMPNGGINQTRTLTFASQNRVGSAKASEPLVYVNDVLKGGGRNIELNQGPGAVDALDLINPNTVDHVEVINTPNSRIGMEGGSGLIAIYLKPGMGQKKTFDVVRIPGYYKPRTFRSPDYNDPGTNKNLKDYRSTLYWNPDLGISPDKGETSVTFFASDLPGQYRVVVEGVTDKGEPVRCERFIDVR